MWCGRTQGWGVVGATASSCHWLPSGLPFFRPPTRRSAAATTTTTTLRVRFTRLRAGAHRGRRFIRRVLSVIVTALPTGTSARGRSVSIARCFIGNDTDIVFRSTVGRIRVLFSNGNRINEFLRLVDSVFRAAIAAVVIVVISCGDRFRETVVGGVISSFRRPRRQRSEESVQNWPRQAESGSCGRRWYHCGRLGKRLSLQPFVTTFATFEIRAYVSVAYTTVTLYRMFTLSARTCRVLYFPLRSFRTRSYNDRFVVARLRCL